MPLSSTGNNNLSATFNIYIGPDSDITYTAPEAITVGRNRTRAINALEHIAENAAFAVTCGDASGVDNTKLTSVTRTGCVFIVDPIDTLTSADQGDTTFTVAFTSDGGDTVTGTFTVNIGPDSNIVFTPPQPNFSLLARTSAVFDLGALATDGDYTIACGQINALDLSLIHI